MTNNTQEQNLNDMNGETKELIEKYEGIQEEANGYVKNTDKALSYLENPERIGANGWKQILEKKIEYKENIEELEEELGEVYEGLGESWETIKELEKEFDYLPTKEDIDELKDDVRNLTNEVGARRGECKEDIEGFDDIFKEYKNIVEVERKIEGLREENNLSEEDIEKIYEKKGKERKRKKKIKKLREKINKSDDDNFLDDMEKSINEMKRLEREQNSDGKSPVEEFPVTEETIDKIYSSKKDLEKKRSKYKEKIDSFDEEYEEKIEDVFNKYEEFVIKREELDKAKSNYESLEEMGYNDERIEKLKKIIDKEDNETNKYNEFKEKMDILSEKLNDEEVRNKMMEKGRKGYKKNGTIYGIYEDHDELSVGSLLGLIESKKKIEDLERAEEIWKEYEEKRDEMDLPNLTASMVAAGTADLDTFRRSLGSIDGQMWELRDDKDLLQVYEILDALEDKPSKKIPDKLYYAGGIAGGLLLVGAAAAGLAAHEENTELENINGIPMLVERQDMDMDIESVVEGNITGTLQSESENTLELDIVEAFEGSFLRDRNTGEVYLPERDGSIEFGTGDVSQALNETTGNVTLDEANGTLEITDGELQGIFRQVSEETLESELNAAVDGKAFGELEHTTSTLPFFTGGAALGAVFGHFASKGNDILTETREKGLIQNRLQAAELASTKASLNKSLDEGDIQKAKESVKRLERLKERLEE